MAAEEHRKLMLRYTTYMKTFPSQSPDRVVQQVSEGNDFATQGVVNYHDAQYAGRLVNAGLIDALLDHLQTPLEPVDEKDIPVMPTVWINALLNLCHKNNMPPDLLEPVRLKVVQRLGPLTAAMCDFDRRELFGAKDDWLAGLYLYIGLVSNLVLTPASKRILEEQGDIKGVLVRILYLDLYGDDLKKEIRKAQARGRTPPDYISNVQDIAACALQEFADVPRNPSNQGFDEPQKEELRTLANILVSPNSNVTLCSGLFELFHKASQKTLNGRGYASLHYIFRQINEAIEFEVFHVESTTLELVELWKIQLNSSRQVERDTPDSIYTSLVRLPSRSMACDTEVGYAVKTGLIELCLQSLAKSNVYVTEIDRLLSTVGVTVLQPKTFRAIKKKASLIREALHTFRGRVPQAQVDHVRGLLDKASLSTVPVTGLCRQMEACRWCLKTLDKDERKQCSSCRRASYCSKDCQVRDWRQGSHKIDCKQMKMNDVKHLDAGFSQKEAKRALKSEANLSMSGNVLFSNNIPKILLQASARGFNILECIIALDFRELKPTIEIMSRDEFLEGDEGLDELSPERVAHSKRILERNFSNGALTCICITFVGDGCEKLVKTFPKDAAPTSRFRISDDEPSWLVAQRDVELESGLDFNEIRSDPKAYASLLENLSHPS
mmetsp:Transcript_26678/g.48431  ORF Transcript_26678/g.48431 Transcript_26678/m.48431 type:complete len:666 (-) Transcript_26678:378-2375(-)